jgi:hypothetical protein
MGWLRNWRTDRAAKNYARRMQPWLQRRFGHSDRYTAAQIRAAVPALKLDGDFIGLGYATFLSQEEFDALRAEMAVPFAYDDARALFARVVPARLFSALGEAAENAYAMSTVGDGHTPSHSGGDATVGN